MTKKTVIQERIPDRTNFLKALTSRVFRAFRSDTNRKLGVSLSYYSIVLTLTFTGVFTMLLSVSFAAIGVPNQKDDKVTPQEVTKPKILLFIGDSLTEGFGVKKEEAFPEIAGKVLTGEGHAVKVVNGGISGSVSADADRRLKWFLKTKPDILILALGSNDALKGTPPDVIKKNLASVIDIANANGIKVLLVGAKVFANFGDSYNTSLDKMYASLAREKKVAYMPFLLKSVALKPELNQSDMKHPNSKGHELVGKDVAHELEKLL
jgi:acyl-CoA thioesterase-1